MKTAGAFVLVASGAVVGFALAQEGKKPDKLAAPDPQELLKPPPPVQDKFLDGFVGTWKGTSTFMGQAFEGATTFEWVLGHQFVKGTSKEAGARMSYESEAFWQVKDGEYTIWGFDSMGSAQPVKGRLEGNVLSWSGSDETFGPSRGAMTMKGPDEMTWTTEADPEKDGTHAKLGEGTYRRAKKKGAR